MDGIRNALSWAGLDYDYGMCVSVFVSRWKIYCVIGPGKGGPHGPYFQSERLDLYHAYTKRLLDVCQLPHSTQGHNLILKDVIQSGHAYRCFCSPDQLNSTREKLARTGSNLTYDKTCLHLTDEEVARKVKAGEKSIVRLNVST